MAKELTRYFTIDQNLKFLVDDALFSDSLNARMRAVNQIAREYGMGGVPTIEREIIGLLPPTDETFRVFCLNVIEKIKDES